MDLRLDLTFIMPSAPCALALQLTSLEELRNERSVGIFIFRREEEGGAGGVGAGGPCCIGICCVGIGGRGGAKKVGAGVGADTEEEELAMLASMLFIATFDFFS